MWLRLLLVALKPVANADLELMTGQLEGGGLFCLPCRVFFFLSFFKGEGEGVRALRAPLLDPPL